MPVDQHVGGGARRIPRAHWPASRSNSDALTLDQKWKVPKKWPPPPHDSLYFIAVVYTSYTYAHV